MDMIAAAEHATICTKTGQRNTDVVTLLPMLVKIAKIRIARYKSIIAMMVHWTILLSVHGCVKNATTWIEGISARSAFKTRRLVFDLSMARVG